MLNAVIPHYKEILNDMMYCYLYMVGYTVHTLYGISPCTVFVQIHNTIL